MPKTKVTVVLNVNGVIDTSAWSDKVDSILLAYMGGQETGSAVADVLSGAVNPSGKLAQTMPASYSDVPSSATFPGADTDGDGLADKSYYNEGIYVGVTAITPHLISRFPIHLVMVCHIPRLLMAIQL